MLGIGSNELVLIALFSFVIFGPDKLPAMAKTVGQAIARFRAAQNEMNQVIDQELSNAGVKDFITDPLDALEALASMDEAKSGDSDEASHSDAVRQKPKVSADELYGIMPSSSGSSAEDSCDSNSISDDDSDAEAGEQSCQ